MTAVTVETSTTTLRTRQMKTQDITITIAAYLAANKNLMILGTPGMGKSAMIVEGIEQAGLSHCIINGAICDPLDSKGALFVDREARQAHYAPIGVLNDILEGKVDVVVLDDLTQSPMAMQNAFMQWVQARMIGDRKIPDHVRFVAAGNRPEDRAGVQQMSAALSDRFTIIHGEPDHQAWVAWAISADLDPRIISFVARKNGDGFCDQGVPKTFGQAVPTARGYERCSDILAMQMPANVQRECFVGAIGEGFTCELMGHLAVCDSLPDYNDILDNPGTADIPTGANVLFALSNALLRAVLADDPRSQSAFRYLERMCEDGQLEIATFAIQTIQQVDQLMAKKTGKKANHLTGAAFNSLVLNHIKHMLHGE